MNRYQLKLIRIILVLILCLQSFAQSSELDQKLKRINTYVDSVYSALGVAGISISIGIDDKIVWNKGYGFADIEQDVKVDPSKSLFRVGSVAKSITATAIGLLYEQGKLDLDAPIQTYVPSFPKKKWPITTRQLAGHLAGIRHYKAGEFLSTKHYPTVLEGLDIFKDDPLLHEPNSKYRYSSYAWNLISAAIEGAADEEFLSYMQTNVFDKIGMKSTYADYVTPIIKHRGRYYRFEDDKLVNDYWVDNSYKWAGGGFLSTSDDLIRFGFAHLNTSILKQSTIDLLWKSQSSADGTITNYGIGWRSGELDSGDKWVGHSGGSVGGQTMFMVIPEKKIVIAVITNMSGVGMVRTARNVANILIK